MDTLRRQHLVTVSPPLRSSLHGFSTLRFSVLLSPPPYLYATDRTISLYTHPRSVHGHLQGPVVLRWPRCPGVLRCPDGPCCADRPPHNRYYCCSSLLAEYPLIRFFSTHPYIRTLLLVVEGGGKEGRPKLFSIATSARSRFAARR
jgi:hypothetical protein